MPPRPAEWDAQDWILVATALTRAPWEPDLDGDRAFELARGVADQEGLPLPELLLQDAAPPQRRR